MATGLRGIGCVRNRVLLVLVAAALAAALGLDFLTFAPNRLLSGRGVALPDLLAGWHVVLLLPAAVLVAAVFTPPSRGVQHVVAVAGSWLLAALVWLAGDVATGQSASGSAVARVSFGGGFWWLVALAWLAAADALQRLRLSHGGRTLAHAAVLLPLLALLGTGMLDELSLLKEYANRRDVFHAAALRHGQIVAATLLPSLLLGVPLGWPRRAASGSRGRCSRRSTSSRRCRRSRCSPC